METELERLAAAVIRDSIRLYKKTSSHEELGFLLGKTGISQYWFAALGREPFTVAQIAKVRRVPNGNAFAA